MFPFSPFPPLFRSFVHCLYCVLNCFCHFYAFFLTSRSIDASPTHTCLFHPPLVAFISSHLFLFAVSSLVSFLQPSLLPPFSFMFLLSSVPTQILLQRCLSCSSPHQLLLWWLGGRQTASGDICGARKT